MKQETPQSGTKDDRDKQIERLQMLGHSLAKEVEEFVGKKAVIEDRWLTDLYQYHGVVLDEEKSRLKDAKKSSIFVNITRNKVNAATARLIDLAFPSDRRNWGLQPTPVPELKDLIQKAKHITNPGATPDGAPPQGQPPGAAPEQNPAEKPKTQEELQAEKAEQIVAQAKKAAENMTKEIEDQLTEADWAPKCREGVMDAVILGSMVLKAPVVIGRTRRAWESDEDGFSTLNEIPELRPGVERVSPWDFFPDLNARRVSECDKFYERRTVTKTQLAKLADSPGYEPFREQFKFLLETGPAGSTMSKLDEIRQITGNGSVDRSNFYEIWEYHGPVSREDLVIAGVEEEDLGEDDPFKEHSAVIVFCQGHVLRASLNPLETEESPYSVFCWEDDDSSIFGTGVPYRLRNAQKVMNATWRMMLDSSALSIGPQIIFNKAFVTPSNGSWEIEGRKLWEFDDRQHSARDVFHAFEITNNNSQLMELFTQARRLSDEETNLPLLAQGDQRAEHTKTASGMQMLLASADVVMRRIIRAFDDTIIVPVLRRFYDWNMMYSDKPEIKGDFEIQALGSVAMMEAAATEESIQEFMSLADHPSFGSRVDKDELLRRVLRARKLDPAGLIVPPEEREQPGPDPMISLKQQELEIKMQEVQLKAQELQFESQIRMAELEHKKEVDSSRLTLEYELKKEQMERTAMNTDASLSTQRDMEMSRQELERERDRTKQQIAALDAKLKQLEIRTKAPREKSE